MSYLRWWIWVCCGLLPLAAQAEDYPSVEILVPFVELHTAPDERYPIHDIAEHGQQVSVIKRRARWYKVRTSEGKQGWVSDEQLRSSLTAAGLASLPETSSDYHP
ncbi:MAG: hypothetical protein JWQ90_4329 [Hydrocarboniphaga sp.]|uniref:SH3 domain-containing protein n=1 Tax=Hydrocarboniphaga sp. TaxID=2033016 RepID=UPI002617EAF3|nr:SH3 domain-containing protein [Hydrocarboniphaga sp.]MDB5971879.1 hypothetical protein [Hydrocarboniphaga sp.]